MAPKIFITGITGYVGGTVFQSLIDKHPDYEITAYVRKTPSGFAEKFPNFKLVHGTWDDAATLRTAANEADIVVQCGNSDHLGAVNALLDGVAEGGKAQGKRSFYIHLGGTATIADFSEPNAKDFRGKLNPKRYSDVADVAEVTLRPDDKPHRHTDKAILTAGTQAKDVLGTAIVCPPDMYGRGTGPVKVESVYLPAFVVEAQKLGGTFYYGDGTNLRGWSHVKDTADVFVRLIEEAAAGGGQASWGEEGYYFTTSEEVSQRELAIAVGKVLADRGLIKDAQPKQVGDEVIENTLSDWGWPGLGWYMWAGNSRAVAERAAKVLGWSPKAKKLQEKLPADVLRALESGFGGHVDLIAPPK